jgi:hypothetical protein
MRRSKYFALATGLIFAMPAHAQTTEKATITLPPGSKDTVKPTTNTEAGPPQLQKPASTKSTTTTTKSTTTK